MTNKEAAAIVERIRYYMEGGECWTDAEFIAMDMAIEALTAQPDDDDTISRQAAIDAFGLSEKTRKYGGDHSGYDTRMLYEIQDVLEGLPSAEPEPCLDLIVSEIEETIRETKENGKRHDINIRANGELICYGLQLALDIIEEKKNERIN